MTVNRKNCAKVIEKILCYILVLVITPCFFIFEMTIVRPIIVEIHNVGIIEHILNVMFSTFCFVNSVGNMIFGIFIDTSLRKSMESDSYCELCKMKRPAKAWHCKTCNVCILRRDHHCFFFSRCIGLKNQRYYVLYLGYIFIAMIYSTYYNYYYILTKFNDQGVYLSIFRIVNPFLRYIIPEPLAFRDLYALLLLLNIGLIFWSGGLFFFHMKNVLRGVTAHEYKDSACVDWLTMKRNFVNVFGVKWYWALVSPFADSPLPEDDCGFKIE